MAALTAALNDAQQAAAAATAAHHSSIQQLQQQHAAQLAQQAADMQAAALSQQQIAQAAAKQQLQQQWSVAAEAMRSMVQQVHAELCHCQEDQQAVLASADAAVCCALRQALVGKLQLQGLRAELSAMSSQMQQVVAFATTQHDSLQQLQREVAEAAPQGLAALVNGAATAR